MRAPTWPVRRQKPPAGHVEIDWTHPLARKLAGLWIFSEGAGSPRDLTRNAALASLTGSSKWVPGLGATNGIEVPSGDLALDVKGGSYSLAYQFYLEVAPGGWAPICIKYQPTGLPPFAYGLLVEPNGTYLATTHRAHAQIFNHNVTISQLVGTTSVFHTIHDRGAGQQKGYLNGKSDSSGSMVAPGSGDGQLLVLDADATGRVDYLAIWNGRVLTADEVLWNYLEPYAFLRPVIRRRIFTGTSGAIIVPVGQVTETDLAQPIAWAPKRRLVGMVSETDIAQAVFLVSSGQATLHILPVTGAGRT